MKKLKEILNNTRMIDDSDIQADTLHGLADLVNHVGGFKNKKCLEVGCFRGVSSEVFLLHKPKEMHFVDLWGKDSNYTESNWALDASHKNWDSIKSEFEKRIEPYKETTDIIVHHKSSKEASKNIADKYFDFIYIDGDHSYNAVKADISHWLPKLSEGGYFCGHDYTTTPDIQKACNEIFDKNKITTFSDSSFVVQK